MFFKENARPQSLKQQEMGDKAIKIERKDEDDAGKQQQKSWPPKKMTKNIKGGQRDYNFQQTVKSVDELNNFRFKHSCREGMGGCKPLPNFESHTMPCTKRYQPEKCAFELLAVHQESGTIHVYSHSKHNHQLMPEEKRANSIPAKELMPAENPPRIFQTPDNTEWKFVQTFADYDQMQKFRRKSRCRFIAGRENHQRFRLPCTLRKWRNCEFQLLALKTTSAGFHVYTFSEHNHPAAVKSKKKQQHAARGHQQKQQEQGMEVDEEEDQEENEADEEEESEEDEVEEGQDQPIEEGGGGGEEDDNLIKLEQQQGEKQGSSMEKTTETPLENEAIPRVETLEEKLQKAQEKVYKWMAGIEPNQIGPTLGEWDTVSVLKMVEMADQEIRENPAKFAVWRPWLKVAIKKCMSQMEDFCSKYKHLIVLMIE